MPMEVMVRFGRWDEILAEPDNYADYMTGTRAFHHAARAIAYAAKGDTENARKEQAIFLEKAKLVPKEETFGNNTSGSDPRSRHAHGGRRDPGPGRQARRRHRGAARSDQARGRASLRRAARPG